MTNNDGKILKALEDIQTDVKGLKQGQNQIRTVLKVLEAGQNDIRENMATKADV